MPVIIPPTTPLPGLPSVNSTDPLPGSPCVNSVPSRLGSVTIASLTRNARRRKNVLSHQKAIAASNDAFFTATSATDPPVLSPSFLELRYRANIRSGQSPIDLARTSTTRHQSRYSGNHHVPVYGRSNAALNMTQDGRPLTYRLVSLATTKLPGIELTTLSSVDS